MNVVLYPHIKETVLLVSVVKTKFYAALTFLY